MLSIVYRDYGPPKVLVREVQPDPEPAADEILIRVEYASINPIDARLRSGEARWMLPGGFPRIPGYDVAGRVVQVGKESPFEPGQRVMAFLDHLYGGGYAELASCTHTAAVAIPESMPSDEAAALPLAGSTALQSLADHGHMEAEERVLITGASGGVGAFAVQIANARGAEVTAVASGKYEEFVRELGAAEFIDYTETDFAKTSRKWDLVFDAAGKSSFAEVKDVLTDDGQYVTTEPSVSGLITSMMTWPMSKQATPMLAHSRAEDLAELVRLYASDQLRVTIDREYPMEEAAEAHRHIENDSFAGKLVLKFEA